MIQNFVIRNNRKIPKGRINKSIEKHNLLLLSVFHAPFFKYFLAFIFFSLSVYWLQAQSISGYLINEHKEPVPFANIFVKEIQSGTSSDAEGHFFLTLTTNGEYELIISSVGYETQSIKVLVGEEEVKRNIQLQFSKIELEEIVIKASKRDPAYAIIQKVIDHKKAHLQSVKSFKTEVYVKAVEVVEKREKKPKKQLVVIEETALDPFEAEEKAKQNLLSSLNMVEMQLSLHYEYPKKYKEIRTAYKAYGKKEGLFIPRFGETDFNFYRNKVTLTDISEVPLISPISNTAILSYKYKLIESIPENGQLVHKIKIIPRKTGNATCSGYLYINDGLWNINRLDLNFYKGGLRYFDALQLQQKYEQLEDKTWIPTRQEFIYKTKMGKRKIFKGNTVLTYSNYQKDFSVSN